MGDFVVIRKSGECQHTHRQGVGMTESKGQHQLQGHRAGTAGLLRQRLSVLAPHAKSRQEQRA
eukprot:8744552-Alexandrium_andersonii.AAC.1